MLGIGVSTVNPNNLDPTQLPKVSPLVPNNSKGFWSKALKKGDCQEGNTLCVYLSKEDTLMYEVNGGTSEVLLSNLKQQGNLWLLFDIFGSVKVLEIITGLF